jgi:hypothetical protein
MAAGASVGAPQAAVAVGGKGWLWAVVGLGGLTTLFAIFSASTLPGSQAGYPKDSGIPKVYWPIYTTAASEYRVSPYLLASIHMQESRFSGQVNPGAQAAQGVASGVNSYGCCAGPLQFNLSNTWAGHRDAFIPIADARPATYPLDRRNAASCGGQSSPAVRGQGGRGAARAKAPAGSSIASCEAYRSCSGVPDGEGCVYDDFDAIAAAAHKLAADGADPSLDSAGTHRAVCAYIGDCMEVDDCIAGSPNQYCQVLPRAREWEQMGAASVVPVANAGPISGGARGIVERAAVIAEPFGTFVVSDHRPFDYGSDHSRNDAIRAARDIAVPGIDALAGPPSPRLDRAVVAIGAALGRSYRPGQTIIDTFEWRGYRVQVIWRTPLYGGHMGHIHIGALRSS